MGLSDVRYFVGVLDAGMLQKLKSYVDERMEESVLLKNAIKLCGRVFHDFVHWKLAKEFCHSAKDKNC